ncbi:MAG: Rid family detoxifying hydrolase [Candidatus Promineifilaceae bacterium]
MSKTIVSSPAAPAAMGPYSQAVRAGRFLFLAGQLGLDPAAGRLAGDDVAAQTEQAIRNLEAVLAAAGAGLGDVVKTTVFLRSMADFGAMNEVYGRHFSADPPARSTVAVADLPRDGARVEIEAVALLPG